MQITNNFSPYSFYMNTNIYGDFQICISVLLNIATDVAISIYLLHERQTKNNSI